VAKHPNISSSSPTSCLVAPPIKLSTVGSRAFPVAAAQVWKGLPEAIVSSSSLQTFRRQLKTHPFQLSYPHLIFWPFHWHRYIGHCSNDRYLGHSKNLCLLNILTNLVAPSFSSPYTIRQQNSDASASMDANTPVIWKAHFYTTKENVKSRHYRRHFVHSEFLYTSLNCISRNG